MPPCVRFPTLPVLVMCHTPDIMLTERRRHHIGILPQHLPAACSPVCLYQRLLCPLCLPTWFLSPALFLCNFLCWFFFILRCSAAPSCFSRSSLFPHHLHFSPPYPNLQVSLIGRCAISFSPNHISLLLCCLLVSKFFQHLVFDFH